MHVRARCVLGDRQRERATQLLFACVVLAEESEHEPERRPRDRLLTARRERRFAGSARLLEAPQPQQRVALGREQLRPHLRRLGTEQRQRPLVAVQRRGVVPVLIFAQPAVELRGAGGIPGVIELGERLAHECDRALALPRVAGGAAGGGEQLEAVAAAELERALELHERLRERVHAQRLFGGAQRLGQRLVARACDVPVVCELRRGCAGGGQRAAEFAVEALALVGHEVAVDHLADQGMAERDAPVGVVADEEARVEPFPDRRPELLLADDAGEHLVMDAPAGGRGDREHASGRR